MTLQTYEMIHEIITSMKQLCHVYASTAKSCSDDLDEAYYSGKQRGLSEGITEIYKVISKYETQEKKEWKNSINK